MGQLQTGISSPKGGEGVGVKIVLMCKIVLVRKIVFKKKSLELSITIHMYIFVLNYKTHHTIIILNVL